MQRANQRGGEAVRLTVISILMIAVMAMLAGCGESEGDRSATVRYRTIIALKVDGKTREFSSVMQTRYTRITQSLMGAGGSVSDWGEAVVIDLGKRGKAYMLVSTKSRTGEFSDEYGFSLKESFGIKNSLGSLTQEDIETLRTLSGRVPLSNINNTDKKNYYPMIVAFKDESDPKSIFEVKRDNLSSAFGAGVSFENVYLEITKEDVSSGVVFQHLPWLKNKYDAGFEKRPSGDKTPREERPAKWRVNYDAFFAEESR
jgi:hypothetical protein